MIKYIMEKNFEKNLGLLIYVLLSIGLFTCFFYSFDPAGSGGFPTDFYNTWPYVEYLTKNFFGFPSVPMTDNTPLNYMFLSWMNFFLEDKYLVRLFFCFVSLLTPILFYIAMKTKYEYLDKNFLLIFSTLIFLFPSFISGAIWGNNSITANIFFLIFLIYFNKWLKKEEFSKINLNIIFQTFFLALAVYSRQYYALIYLFAMYIYFIRFDLRNFMLISLIVFIFSLPGFWIIMNDPRVLQTIFTPTIYNTILISPSIMSFYLIPIFLLLFLQGSFSINFKEKNNLISFSLISFLIIFISFIFDYNILVGGGFFVKLSYLTFGNNILGVITSIIGLFFLYLIARENKDNMIIIMILILGFPSMYIFQEYFEPMFFFIFFLMLNSKYSKLFFQKKINSLLLSLYLFSYLGSAIVNDIFKFTKNIS